MRQFVYNPKPVPKFELVDWQTYWPRWWNPLPWFHYHEQDEDGPAELFCGIWIFQFDFQIWDA